MPKKPCECHLVINQDGDVAGIRAKALKSGAVSISNRPLKHGYDEMFISFNRKADYNAFIEWMNKKHPQSCV
jgi:hypothetical protein